MESNIRKDFQKLFDQNETIIDVLKQVIASLMNGLLLIEQLHSF